MLPQVVSLNEQEHERKRLLVAVDDAQKVPGIVVREVLLSACPATTHSQHISEDGVEDEAELLLGDELDEVRAEVRVARPRLGKERRGVHPGVEKG